ncbi:MAG: hypothetical protein LHV69_03495 [Elusimicrobia bacterium]|nr:hypothetical protein [Candidatus Obscuribacterium magneticum]
MTAGFILLSSIAFAAPENLDEMFNRKSRRSPVNWPYQELEAANNYNWQPETFMYHDITTGHEVWKLSDTPLLENVYHDDIGVSPWSADGRRMALFSNRPSHDYLNGNDFNHPLWMTVDTKGTHFRPTVEAAGRWAVPDCNDYFHWSPQIPNVYYEMGCEYWPHEGQDLYKTTVSDLGVTKEAILRFPQAVKIRKMISGDGKKLLLTSRNTPNVFYPTTVWPTPRIDDADGYPIDRDLGAYGDTPPDPVTPHDMYYAGTGEWYFILYEGYAA